MLIPVVFLLLPACWSLTFVLAQTIITLPSACGRDQLATLSDPAGTFGIRLPQYPNNLSCRWRISTPDRSKRIRLSFSHLHTECSYDFVNVYDGPEPASGSIVGKMCGNRTSYVNRDVFVSTGPNMVVEFITDIDVQGTGFMASYEVVDACDNGRCFGRGSCVNGQCVCMPGAGGTMCEKDSAGNQFMPRFSHAATYLNGTDTMLVTGGQTLTNVLPFDNLQYSFNSQQWDDVNPPSSSNSPIPSPRYSHTMVTLGSRVFMFGGITLFGISSELWEYFPNTRQWTQLRPGIVLPGLYWPTLVAAQEENKLFLMGGWTQKNGYFSASRLAFAYDLVANTWKQLNSSSHPLQTFASSVASPGVYRPQSRFIHLFTQTSIHSYHVPTDLWYFDLYSGGDLNLESRMYRTGNLMGASKSHVALFGGQLSALSAGSLSDMCFSDRLHVFDLDCMRVVNATSIVGKNRRSHTAIVRGANADELVVLGGHNGADLGDLVQLQVPIPRPSSEEQATCRQAHWCAKFNDCADCVAKPGCGWCDGTCKYQCDNDVCPARTIIPLGSAITSKLTAGSSIHYKVFINEPEKDVFFELYAPDRVRIPAIRMSIVNLPKNGTFTTTEAASYISSTDDRRFGGWYVIRLDNTDTARDFTYTFMASVQTTNVRTPSPNDDFNSQLMLGVGVLCLLASGMIAFRQAVRRQRQVIMGVNPNSPMAIPKVGATMHQIHVDSLLPASQSPPHPPHAPARQASSRGLFHSAMLPLLNTAIKSSAALPPSSPSLEKATDPGSPASGAQMLSSALSHRSGGGEGGGGQYLSNDPILIPMSPMTPKTTIGRSNGPPVSTLLPQHITPLSVEVHTLPTPDPTATKPIAFVTYLVTMPGTPRDLVSKIPIMCAATAVVPMTPEAMSDLPNAGNATMNHSRTSKSRQAARRRLQVLMERLRVNRGPADGGAATRGEVAALGSPMAPIGLTPMNGRL